MAKKSEEKKSCEKPKAGQLVRVRNMSGRDGYRRGGVAHPALTPVDHPAGTFDDEQLQQLHDDPNIDVSYFDAPKDEKKSEGK